jgi:hypothetical protein
MGKRDISALMGSLELGQGATKKLRAFTGQLDGIRQDIQVPNIEMTDSDGENQKIDQNSNNNSSPFLPQGSAVRISEIMRTYTNGNYDSLVRRSLGDAAYLMGKPASNYSQAIVPYVAPNALLIRQPASAVFDDSSSDDTEDELQTTGLPMQVDAPVSMDLD